MGLLDNKRAVVVGGGQAPGETVGNGRATALAFGREGAVVMVVDRVLDRAESTADEIRAAGGQAFAHAADITDESQVRQMITTAEGTMGGIDILHNNVGVGSIRGDAPVTDIDLGVFSEIMAINLTGMVSTCKHAIPVMQGLGGGVILGVGSLASLIYHPTIAYQSSKVAVVSLMRNIALAHAADGIRANAIIPGYIDTPMAIEHHVDEATNPRDQIVERRNARVPLRGQQGTAWDVAEAAVFLASDKARFITGIALPVDGGQSLTVGTM